MHGAFSNIGTLAKPDAAVKIIDQIAEIINGNSKLDDIHRAHFLGIGGIGMSSLALYFISKGVQVSGYDRTESSITKELVQKGADVFYDDQINFILDKKILML